MFNSTDRTLLRVVLSTLRQHTQMLEKIMAESDDLKAAVAAESAEVQEVLSELDAQAAQIKALTDQLANASQLSPAEIEDLASQINKSVTTLHEKVTALQTPI
jgi:SMC interacting uncharacterized protein involved in chromosome segregation